MYGLFSGILSTILVSGSSTRKTLTPSPTSSKLELVSNAGPQTDFGENQQIWRGKEFDLLKNILQFTKRRNCLFLNRKFTSKWLFLASCICHRLIIVLSFICFEGSETRECRKIGEIIKRNDKKYVQRQWWTDERCMRLWFLRTQTSL